eukprot:3864583-Prymnesium_polylepis.1
MRLRLLRHRYAPALPTARTCRLRPKLVAGTPHGATAQTCRHGPNVSPRPELVAPTALLPPPLRTLLPPPLLSLLPPPLLSRWPPAL